MRDAAAEALEWSGKDLDRLVASGTLVEIEDGDEGQGLSQQIGGAVHEMMSDAHDAGVVSRATLRTFVPRADPCQ